MSLLRWLKSSSRANQRKMKTSRQALSGASRSCAETYKIKLESGTKRGAVQDNTRGNTSEQREAVYEKRKHSTPFHKNSKRPRLGESVGITVGR